MKRLIGQLMLGLYRSGRQAEALQWFERTRQWLCDELGADPGPGLQSLHQQILRGDSSLLSPDLTRTAAPIPRQLPADVSVFTGREAELAELDRLLTGATGERAGIGADGWGAAPVLISAVSGTAGVGKTATAVRWAHRVVRRFPDGQLYVNLRGYDPREPVDAADALAGFLRALGVPSAEIPLDTDERAAKYRSLLAGRRVLVLLDNARQSEQVRLLLPGSPESVAVITSRDSLTGLVARDGARRLNLDLLPMDDAVSLLKTLIGARVDDDLEAAITLAALCARLPLALRVAAEIAIARPTVPLADLAGELAHRQRRLDSLDADGDVRTAIRAVFSWSYRQLDGRDGRMFRLAGLHPGADFDVYAGAAVTGTTVRDASLALSRLARAHLVFKTRSGRYGMHDLLSSYARELADTSDNDDEISDALARLFGHYLNTAVAVVDSLFPAEAHEAPVPGPTTERLPVADSAAARAWLDAERANLVAMARSAADQGCSRYVTGLATTVFRYLEVGGYYAEAEAIFGHARRAASQAGDDGAEAGALTSLGLVDLRRGNGRQAAEHLQRALALFRQKGDRAGESRVLHNLGLVDLQQGRYEHASVRLREALAHYREVGDPARQARTIYNLGLIHQRQGRYEQATEHLQEAQALHRDAGNLAGVARALCSLGAVDVRQGRHEQAAEHLQQALELSREIGDRAGEAYVLADLALAEQVQGRHEQAAVRFEEALALFRGAGDMPGETATLNGLGEVLVATGRPGQARLHLTTALALAGKIGEKYEQARAHKGLGSSYMATDNAATACIHWQQALALFTELGAPEADAVRSELLIEDNLSTL